MQAEEKPFTVLAIDIGMGTQDILHYNSLKDPENNIKMVFPSPTRLLAERILRLEENLFVRGVTMGGGPLSFALKKHVEKGYRVVMQEEAAYTVRDDLEQVKKMGIEIGQEPPFQTYTTLETRDVDMELYREILGRLGVNLNFDYIAVGVQDHGRAPRGESDRVFRFRKLRKLMEEAESYQEMGYTRPPSFYTRMQGVSRTIQVYGSKILIADSKVAAIVGALHGVRERPAIAIDVGNGHTLAAMVGEDDRVIGMLEHHTGLLNREKLEGLIERFAEGAVSNREVYEDSGHGCHVAHDVGIENVERVLVTGPRRGTLAGSRLGVEFANPIGDVMMTGTIGLVDMVRHGAQ